MNIMPAIAKIFPQRNRPIRCKSRWRKALDRRNRPHKIIKADRKNPFMTIQYFYRTEEERQEIERRNLLMLTGLGTVMGPSMFQPGKLEELMEAAAGGER